MRARPEVPIRLAAFWGPAFGTGRGSSHYMYLHGNRGGLASRRLLAHTRRAACPCGSGAVERVVVVRVAQLQQQAEQGSFCLWGLVIRSPRPSRVLLLDARHATSPSFAMRRACLGRWVRSPMVHQSRTGSRQQSARGRRERGEPAIWRAAAPQKQEQQREARSRQRHPASVHSTVKQQAPPEPPPAAATTMADYATELLRRQLHGAFFMIEARRTHHAPHSPLSHHHLPNTQS